MVPFAGWEMPVQYAGIVEEHNAVRQRAGMFDVSHMGRLEVQGANAARFLRYLCTWDITALLPGEGHYCLMCREDGGILDDVYVFALTPERYLVVVNAANAEKIRAWMREHLTAFDVAVAERQASTAMIAVQGPAAVRILSRLLGADFVRGLRPRRCGVTRWRGRELFASRTGYTGEDGLELVIDAEHGPILWKTLLEAQVQPCGLGARDTLRLEAALLLYGNDMDEETNPWEVGLGWVVSLHDGADFVGRAALQRLRDTGVSRRLVCLRARERGIMRAGCPILRSGREVGKVTSGGYSPSLGVSIGMGFVPPDLADPGTALTVDVRGRHLAADVVPRPFYKRPRS
jgi:aminomethyltransferase